MNLINIVNDFWIKLKDQIKLKAFDICVNQIVNERKQQKLLIQEKSIKYIT